MLAVRRRVQGAEHPDTLTSMNNLAETLWAQGDHAGARAIQEEVLAVRRRVLGAEHPNTLTSMNNLANTLADLGEGEAARALIEEALPIAIGKYGEGTRYFEGIAGGRRLFGHAPPVRGIASIVNSPRSSQSALAVTLMPTFTLSAMERPTKLFDAQQVKPYRTTTNAN